MTTFLFIFFIHIVKNILIFAPSHPQLEGASRFERLRYVSNLAFLLITPLLHHPLHHLPLFCHLIYQFCVLTD